MRPAPLPTSKGFRHGTLRRRLAQTSALAGMVAGGPAVAQLAADALPTLPTPSSLVAVNGSTMTVTPELPRTIINWSTYNIGTAATVEYVNPVAVPIVPIAVLNRVQGTGVAPTTISESQILGTLRSADNISVYLVNQAGILFGPDATVSVGSLIASTRDIDDAVFGNVLNNDFRFTGSATAPDPGLLVLDGSQAVTGGSTDPTRFVANNGIVAFIAARVATTGTITASNEVVMVAANDTTLALTPGSPLQVTIAEGSQISTPMLLRGALNGSSILVAAATRNSVTDGLLDIDATMTATSAFASDQGIVLAGGPTASLASNIVIQGDGEIAGNLAIRLGGTLTSDIGVAAANAGRIDVRARNGVQEPAAVAGVVTRADLLADGAVTVRTDLESIALRDVGGQSASLIASRGDIFARNVTIGGGTTGIQASGGAVTGGVLNATYRGAVGLANITAAGPVTVSAGEIAATGAIASTAGSVTLTATANVANAATGAVAIVSANAVGAASDLTINAASITGNPITGRAGLSAGRDLTLTTTGAALLGSASATRNAVLSAADLNASSLSAGGTLNASATSAALLADSVSAGGLATLRAGTTLTVTGPTQSTGGGIDIQAPTVDLATVNAAGDLNVVSTVGSLSLDSGTAGAANTATISAATDALLGALDASRIAVSAGQAITADRLTATLASNVADALTATARTLIVTRAEATNATARLTATVGSAAVTNLVAGENAFLSGSTTATLRGGGRVGGDLTVTGGEVRLGGATGTQEVGGTARYTASTGTIASEGGGGITIRADANPGAPVGAIILDANTGIDLTGIGLVTGDPLGTDNTGDVDVRLAAAGTPLTLGSVDARALLLTPTPLPGAVTLGATRLVNTLALSAPGPISLSSIAISGDNQSLSVTGTGATTAVTATGLLSARNGVAVAAPGAVSVQGVSAGTGAASVQSTGATVSAGALSGASVSARAFGALSYASVNATAGTAMLTSDTAGISTVGFTRASDTITIDAPGVISVGEVTSTNGAVLFRSSIIPVTGALTAGAVSASADLSVSRDAGLTFASATSINGAVSLSAPSGVVAVTGGVRAGTSVSVLGASMTLGSVTADTLGASTGTATLTATSGGITVGGATTAAGDVTFDAPGVIQLGDVRSTATTVVFRSTVLPPTGVINARDVRAAIDLSVSRAAGLNWRSATSDTGSVSLAAPGGVVSVTNGVNAGRSVDVTAASMTLGSVTADILGLGTGIATLTATSGGITVSGATTAAGDVTLDAPGAIALGDVRSTGGTVVVQSTLVPPTGAVTARDVRAATDLSVSRAAGVSFRNVQSDTGSVSLFAPGGAVTVTGTTMAGTSVTVRADTATLAAVDASDGTISLEAVDGALTTGALDATDFIRATASTDATVASAASANASVELLTTTGRIAVAGAITSRAFVTVDAGTSAQLGSVTDTGVGASTLRARDGSLTVTGPTSVGGALDAEASTMVDMNAVRANGALAVTAGTDAALASATSDSASVRLTAGGTLDVTGVTTARTDVVTDSAGNQRLGAVTATIGGVTLTSSAGAITAASVSAVTSLDADASTTLSLPDVDVGMDAMLAGSDVVLGMIDAETLTATARDGDLSLVKGDIRGAATLTATGAATIGVLTASGNISVTAGDAALLTDTLSVGGDLVATGATVTLGSTGRTIEQVATGRVEVTSTSGAITGIDGLTLRSDGLGAGGRDLTLQSAGAITFAPATLLQGGPDRQSAVRLAAGPASAITLDAVEARTIASPTPATALAHEGPVSITRAATRDTLTIALTGGGNPALTIGATEVRAGGVAFSTTGAATLSTIDAPAGTIAVTAGTDLSLGRADAGGAIALTSTGGDIAATALTGGGLVTLRADATDGVRGIVRTASIVGAGGIDIAGRTITAESLTASAGAVTASTRRDAAGITDQAISIGTIDASGAITLATGNRTVPSIASIALDRATSTGGPITITTIGGGLAARPGSPRTILSAAGALSLDIDGAAVLGSASGSATTIAAASLDMTTATATSGALSLTTRSGALVLATGSATDAVTVDAAGPITATTITGASVAVTGTADARLGMVRTTGGDLGVRVAGALDAATLDSARAITVDAGSARITDANARGGSLTATARTGTLRIDAGRTSADAKLTAPALSVGTLTAASLDADAGTGGIDVDTATIDGLAAIDSGGNVAIGTLDTGTGTITAAGALVAGRIAARAGLRVDAASARITETRVTGGATRIAAGAGGIILTDLTAASDVELLTTGALTARTLDVGARLSATGASATVTTARVAGDAAFTATGTDLVFGEAAIGGAATLAAARDVTADRISAGGAFALDAGGVASLTAATADGNARLTAGQIAIGNFATPQALALTAGRIDAATLNAGALTVAAGTGGAVLGQVTVTRAATIGSGADLSIARLTSDSAAIAAAGSLTAGTIATRNGLTATARDAAITSASVTAGPATLTTTAGALGVGTIATAGNLDLLAAGALTVGQADVGGALIATGTSGALTTTRVGGNAAVTARNGALTLGTLGSGGALTLNATGPVNATTLDVGGRLVTTAAALTLGTGTVRGGDAALTVGTADIGALTTSAATRIAATGAVTANRLDTGTAIDLRAASAAIIQASARGGDATMVATAGDIRLGAASASGTVALTSTGATTVTGAVTAGASYQVEAASIALGTTGATTRQAAADVTLVARTGAITAQGSTTIAGTRAVTLTARGGGGAITFAPDTAITSSAADVALATTGVASLGTVTASAGAIRLEASDAALTRAVAAQNVTLTNVATAGVTRLGDAATGNETEFGASATRFDLSNAEIGLVSAPTVTIASGARDVTVGAVGLAAATGSTRFAITAAGRVDMLGRFVAAGSTASRAIAIGSETANARTGVIRIAATQAAGGRLLVDGAVLDLTAERIGAGLDRDFLDAIGYRTAGLGVDQVTRDYVARPTSTLYQPSALGAQPYTDGVLVRSGVLRLTYGSYALFQNTGRLGEQTGVIIGAPGAPAPPGGALRLSAPAGSANTFSLFGTIDGISGQATALLGPDRLSVDAAVSPVASRINGCVIGSGGGCLNTSIAQASLNLFDTSRAEIVRTADDLTLPFDPLIGTNNEALYLDSEAVAAATAAECEGDKPCPTQP